MLMNNDIDGLIKPKLWYVNRRRECRFDVAGKKSFGDIMEERIIGENELRMLFSGIVRILDNVREYLISAEIILLGPDFIYFTDFWGGICF